MCRAAGARTPWDGGHARTPRHHCGPSGLESGGNAIDAAVAVGFALAVTHPSAGNIGGGGFMLIRLADGRTTFIDFRERAPGSASRDMYLDASGKATQDSLVGYRASGVPGTVRGLEYASQKYGKKPWAELVKPAVELASEGLSALLRAGTGFPFGSAHVGTLSGDQPHLPEGRQVLRGRRDPGAESTWVARSTASRSSARRTSTRAKRRGCSRRT